MGSFEDTAEPDGLTHVHSGKVRELYRTRDGFLVLLATDRISAFDFVLSTPIPDKGRVLTALSLWWFDRLRDVVGNHIVATDHPDLPPAWRGRAVVCRPLRMVAIEAVARGYLTGSGLLDYQADQQICGIALPPGLVDGDRLAEAIFTPASKAPLGQHDENVDFATAVDTAGVQTAEAIRDLTLTIYRVAADLARERGIILADTKFEFGHDETTGELLLGDEVLTPDSSRFWPAEDWRPGRAQPSFDKQYVRDWLRSPASGWDRASGAEPPPLPDDVIAATRARYVEAYERLTGTSFDAVDGDAVDGAAAAPG